MMKIELGWYWILNLAIGHQRFDILLCNPYFIGQVLSGQDILIVMLGLLCLHMLGKIFRLIMVIGYLIGIVPKSLHIALSGVSLVFGVRGVAIGHT